MLTAPVTRAMRRLGDYVRERWTESDDTESEASDNEGEGESGESCSKNLCWKIYTQQTQQKSV